MAIDKALEKEPGDRYQTMQDFVADLKRVTRKASVSQPALAARTRALASRLPWTLAAALAVALTAALVPATLYFSRPIAPQPQLRFGIPVPGLAGRGLAVSPNGTDIAYVVANDGTRQIWIRPLGSREARPLPGTEGATGLFWSPDGRQLGFTADGKLKRVDLSGGNPQTIAEITSSVTLPGSWSRDGILYTRGLSIARVSPSGVGSPERATEDAMQVLPIALPDGDHYIYLSAVLGGGDAPIAIGSLTTQERKPLAAMPLPGPSNIEERVPGLAYAGGFLLYVRDTTLLAQRFDAAALEMRGEALPIAENVAEFSASDGVLVYRAANAASQLGRNLVWRDRGGQRLGGLDAPASFLQASLSSDGKRVAIALRQSLAAASLDDIWVIDATRNVTTRLTFDDARDSMPIWSPDGTRVAFNSGRGAGRMQAITSSIYERSASGAGSDRLLFSAAADEFLATWDWSPDGRYVLFGRAALGSFPSRTDIWALPLSGDSEAFPVVESPFREGPARLSPDGRWIAYGTNESGQDQILVQPFPNVAQGKWQVSPRGGYDPRWRADGRELYYLSPEGDVMAVEIGEGDEFDPGDVRRLFATGLSSIAADPVPDYHYAVTGDGERFLINEPLTPNSSASTESPGVAPPELSVVVNWAQGLPRD
jgi:Tol biopolymer transport system component